jgi:polyhydroxyalkanoate synthase
VQEQGGPVHVIGYCMGGLFATALAQLQKTNVRSLMFLATPWDFHAGPEHRAARIHKIVETLTPFLDEWGEMPVDVLQCFFISLQPFFLLEKFQRAAAMEGGSKKWENFVLVEDWVNDGVPLVRRVARECLALWYVENAPAEGIWTVLNQKIDPAKIDRPSLHVIPQHDKIVPPESAKALSDKMRGATCIEPAFGHVSMMGNPDAPQKLWPQLFDWLANRK